MFAISLAGQRTYHGVLLFVLPTDMAHGSGARPKVKEEAGSYIYARPVGLAAEFERAAETKARLKETARRMANDAGMSSTDPRQSGGHDGRFDVGASAPPKHDSREYAQPVWQRGGAYTCRAPCKTPKYSGKADWQAFHAQYELLSQAAGWSEDDKALQLALCLTDDALACLLLLSPEERNNYEALVGALQRRFGHCEQPGLLRSELSNRRRRPGEPLRVLANDIETLARRAYAHMPPAIQTELARDQFIQAITPSGLRIQTQLAHPRSIQEALELALEREIVGGGTMEGSPEESGPTVRTAECTDTAQVKPAWVAEITELIRAVSMHSPQSATRPRQRPLVCWGCGQPGHLLRQCSKHSKDQGNGPGPI